MKKRILALCMAMLFLYSSAGAALTVEDARELVERLYIDEVPAKVLSRPTVEELFDGLDRYSSYFTPEEYEAFRNTMNDVSTVGLGVVSGLSEDGSCLEVSKVLPGGAAEAGGMVAGDRILAVDGRPISQRSDLAALYAQRAPLYARFADAVIDNNGTVADAAKAIWRDFCAHSGD